jgi:nucleotide-binding universal stress UspA family protein
MATVERLTATPPSAAADDTARHPVVLATLSVRVDPSAERMAIDSALHAGARLIVANMLPLPPYPLTFMLAPQYATLPHEEDLDAVRATAARAAARGIATELLRIASSTPVRALLELSVERQAGLLVLGPDLSRTSRRRFRAAARRVRRRADCLVWIAGEDIEPGGVL